MSDRIVVMNAGRIDQVGSPGEIYSRPATPFVADFVGKMNFLKGKLAAADRADVAGAHLHFAPPVPMTPGVDVTVCVRPEDVVFRADLSRANGSVNRLTVQVGVMEFIGSHFATTLHAVGTGLNLSADVAMNDVRDLGIEAGKTIEISLPADRLRVFVEPPR